MAESAFAVIVRVKPAGKSSENIIKVEQNTLRVFESINDENLVPASTTRTPKAVRKRGDDHTGTIIIPKSTQNNTKIIKESIYPFFDKVFPHDSKQEEIFEYVQGGISQVLSGFNSTIFAYGQTGAGKSYTMMGPSTNPEYLGIIPRTVRYIFDQVELRKDQATYTIKFTFVELHNNLIYDLLDPNNDKEKQRKMNTFEKEEHAKKKSITIQRNGKNIFLTGSDTLQSPVSSYEQAIKLVYQGQRCRKVGKTNLNDESSRSHSILTFLIEAKPADGSPITVGKLNLVDLAGQERVDKSMVTGEAMTETNKINQSLNALSNVLISLAKKKNNNNPSKKTIIPYRDHKLTHILRDSLGGNSKTIFIINIRSCAEFGRETIQSLNYGKTIKLIKNVVTVNQEVNKDSCVISKYEQQINLLKQQLGEKTNELQTKLQLAELHFAKQSKTYEKIIANYAIDKENNEVKIKHLIQTHEMQISSLNYELSCFQEKFLPFKQQIYELSCQLHNLCSENKNLENLLESSQNHIDALEQQLLDFEKQNELLTEKLREQKGNSAQKKEYEKLKSELMEVTKKNKKLTLAIEELTKEKEELIVENSECSGRIAGLSDEVKQLKAAPKENNKKLEKRIAELEQQVKKDKKEIDDLNRQIRIGKRDSKPAAESKPAPKPSLIEEESNDSEKEDKEEEKSEQKTEVRVKEKEKKVEVEQEDSEEQSEEEKKAPKNQKKKPTKSVKAGTKTPQRKRGRKPKKEVEEEEEYEENGKEKDDDEFKAPSNIASKKAKLKPKPKKSTVTGRKRKNSDNFFMIDASDDAYAVSTSPLLPDQPPAKKRPLGRNNKNPASPKATKPAIKDLSMIANFYSNTGKFDKHTRLAVEDKENTIPLFT